MSKQQHTPGPWRSTGLHICSNEPYSSSIAMVEPHTTDANARLIAAAPELLSALEDAAFIMGKLASNPKDIFGFLDSLKRSADDANAAITKAKGESL